VAIRKKLEKIINNEAVKMKGKINKLTKNIALALGITMLTPVYGAVNIIANHDEAKSEVATFSQFGVSSEKAKVIKGYGDQMLLETALDIIIPNGWKVQTNDALDTLVDWEGGVTWPYVMEDLSVKNDISVSIDWNNRVIDLFSHAAEKMRMAELEEREDIKSLFIEAEKDVEAQIALEKEEELRKQYEIDKKILEQELAEKKAARESDLEYIASLEEERNKLIEMGDQLTMTLEEKDSLLSEKEQRLSEINGQVEILNTEIDKIKFNNVESNKQQVTEIDLEALKKDYRNKFVLPIDDSFEFYYQGGYEEEFDYYTPANYIAKNNITLRENLEEWCREIGWNLEWKTSVRYPVKYPVKFEGTFKQSVIELISLYKKSKRPLDVDFYPDSNVLVVTDLTHKLKNR
tara:strand:+ start:274 stop:1488 length:1215 start_codon:yes stop_codon:yes gene_type:complete